MTVTVIISNNAVSAATSKDSSKQTKINVVESEIPIPIIINYAETEVISESDGTLNKTSTKADDTENGPTNPVECKFSDKSSHTNIQGYELQNQIDDLKSIIHINQ